MKKWVIATITGVSATAVVGGAVVGVTVPILLKYKDALEKFIPDADHEWVKKEKEFNTTGINYVALGDSVSAGYNGQMGVNYLSFADFYANDLKKAGGLNDYKNFSVSGQKISDIQQQVTRTPSIISRLGNADVVSLSIGGNDLLAYAKLFDLNFGMSLQGIMGMETNPNTSGNHIDPEGNSHSAVPKSTQFDLLNKTLASASGAVKNNDFTGAVSVQPTLVETMFDFIKRDLTMLIGDIGKLAPKANLIVGGEAFPFLNMPSSVVNNEVPELGFSLKTGFERFLDTIEDATTIAEYAEFVNFNEISRYKNDESGQEFNGKVETQDKANPKFRYRKMPNIMDIHPSTYGHELIGNGMFEMHAKSWYGIDEDLDKIFEENKSTSPLDEENLIQEGEHAGETDPQPHPENFERYDESIYSKHATADTLAEVVKNNKTRNLFSEIFNFVDPEITDEPIPTALNNTSYNVSLTKDAEGEPTGFTTAVNSGPSTSSGGDDILTILLDFIGINLDGDLGLDTLLTVISNKSIMEVIQTLSILMRSATLQGDDKGEGSSAPETFIIDKLTGWSEKLISNSESGKIKDAVIKYLAGADNKNINYQDEIGIIIDGQDLKFGEALTKYNEASTFDTLKFDQNIGIGKIGDILVGMLPDPLTPSIAQNQGSSFLEKLDNMGEANLKASYSKNIDDAKQVAANDSETRKEYTESSSKLVDNVDKLNEAINNTNGTDSSDPVNDIWTKLSLLMPHEVMSKFNEVVGLISDDEWKSSFGSTTQEEMMLQTGELINIFKTIDSFTKDTILNQAIDDAVLLKALIAQKENSIGSDLASNGLGKVLEWIRRVPREE